MIDPSQKLRAKRDIGIEYGQIAAIAPSIPAVRSIQRIDATGKLVMPGLVDLHTHLCPHLGLGLPADELVPITCTTTAVSAGDAGWHTWGVFRHRAAAPRDQAGRAGGPRHARDLSQAHLRLLVGLHLATQH